MLNLDRSVLVDGFEMKALSVLIFSYCFNILDVKVWSQFL